MRFSRLFGRKMLQKEMELPLKRRMSLEQLFQLAISVSHILVTYTELNFAYTYLVAAMSRREKMDVVKLVAHDDSVWWDAELSDADEETQCVIGLVKGDKSLSDASRKRRRMN